MILRKLKNCPERMVPVAMAMVVVGLSILGIAIAWPHFSPSLPSHSGTDWNDFARGFLYGLAITLETAGVVFAAGAAAAIKKRKAV